MSQKTFILTLISGDDGAIKKAGEKISRWLNKFKTHLGLQDAKLEEKEVISS